MTTNEKTTHTHPDHDDNCPKCGQKMKRVSFRTGSIEKPKEESLSCQRCGVRTALPDQN